MRVCQFRHDGTWAYNAAAAPWPPNQEDLHTYSTDTNPGVKPQNHVTGCSEPPTARTRSRHPLDYSSFAFMVILAFRTFETGHPFSAASAYF